MTELERSAVLGLWQDRPAGEAIDTARLADQLGYRRLWIGEMATFDAVALAMAVGHATSHIELTIGPLAVAVRTPMTMAMAVASVRELLQRQINLAIGTSSSVVVDEWHGRDRSRSAVRLDEHAAVVRRLLEGEKVSHDGRVVRTKGYRLRLDPPGSSLAIAAFGPRAVTTAATHGDTVLLNMVTPAAVARLKQQTIDAANKAGREPPPLALWVAAAVEPTEETRMQIARSKVGYLAAPGYGEMFIEAGFGDLVAFARTRPHPKEILAKIPDELLAAVGVIGDIDQANNKIDEYRSAGLDELCFVPATAGDPGGARTLEALAQ